VFEEVPEVPETVGTQGRYVRVQLTGANYLSLAEVQVLSTGAEVPAPTNLAGQIGHAEQHTSGDTWLPGWQWMAIRMARSSTVR
jgi:hypothetical protein